MASLSKGPAGIRAMNNFAFMIHPIEPKTDVSRRFPLLGKLPAGVINHFSRFFPPVQLSHIVGIRSEATGKEIEGWLFACPLTPKRMFELRLPVSYKKIIQTGRLAERRGARILGLGAFTSVIGDAGLTISEALSIPVTTGNSFTVALAVEASLKAARCMELELSQSVAAVVGAYGSIGRACTRLLARSVPNLMLVGQSMERLQKVREEIGSTVAKTTVTTQLDALRQADIVVAVTSSLTPIIEPDHLKPGSVVCDVARPRNVSRRVVERRDDVLVFEGGVVQLPGDVDFGFDFGLPPGQAYACMAETMLLALEGRYECYSVGRNIDLERVDEIAQLAANHGFCLTGFRSFERTLTGSEIDGIRERAYQRRRLAS